MTSTTHGEDITKITKNTHGAAISPFNSKRLDYILISFALLPRTESSETVSFAFSDQRAVELILKFHNFRRHLSSWKLNNRLLDLNYVKQIGRSLMSTNPSIAVQRRLEFGRLQQQKKEKDNNRMQYMWCNTKNTRGKQTNKQENKQANEQTNMLTDQTQWN